MVAKDFHARGSVHYMERIHYWGGGPLSEVSLYNGISNGCILSSVHVGISLTVEQWGKLKEAIPRIDEMIGST